MKQLFKRIACLLALGLVLALAAPVAALAAEAPYTYTVTLAMGRHGSYNSRGVQILVNQGARAPQLSEKDGVLTISGIEKGTRVTLGNDAADVDQNGKYYVQGVRIGGRDNNTATTPSFLVTADADYVMAYGIKGDMTQYTVHYQDTAGNTLAPSRSYYGNVGDKPVVAYLYIDGYQPLSYNLTKTLLADSSQNVFTFVYTRLAGGGTGIAPEDMIIYLPAPGGARPGTGTTGTTGEVAPEEEVVVVDATPAPTPAGAGTSPNANANNGANAEEAIGDGTPEELTDIDANRTPLANIIHQIAETLSNASPVALVGGGVAAAAVVALLIFLLVARKKKKDEDEAADEQSGQ